MRYLLTFLAGIGTGVTGLFALDGVVLRVMDYFDRQRAARLSETPFDSMEKKQW